jgi:hypothetical protein
MWRPLAVAIPLAVLGLCVAACASETLPTVEPAATAGATAIPDVAGGGVTATACLATVGGEVQFAVLEQLPPDDISGAGGPEEADLNDEPAPPVPEDPDGVVPDLSGVPTIVESASGAQGGPAPEDIVLYARITTLDAGQGASTTAEPQVDLDGERSLLTWNSLAAMSWDGGASYGYVDPSTAFPSVDGGFCCDQVMLHAKHQDLWLWVLQYETGASGSNTIRLAWTDDEGFDARRFRYVDWRASDLGLPSSLFFDQPKMATSNENVYLSWNAYQGSHFDRVVVLRIPFDGLTAGAQVHATCLVPVDPPTGRPLFGLIPTRQAGDTMYLASHVDSTTLGIYRWPDREKSPTYSRVRDVDANGVPVAYPAVIPYACPRQGAAPGTDWCLRPSRGGEPSNGPRPTTAWVANGHVGIAWNASQDATRPFPFVWVIVLDETAIDSCSMGECVLGHPHIVTDEAAVQYAAISENPTGELGAVTVIGGGKRYLQCAMLVHADVTQPDDGWIGNLAGVSDADLPFPSSGDYLGIALTGPGERSWIGTCMSYGKEPGAAGSMRIHVGRFGRFRDAPAS